MIKLFFTVDFKYNWNWLNQKVDPLESGPPVLPKRNFPSPTPRQKKVTGIGQEIRLQFQYLNFRCWTKVEPVPSMDASWGGLQLPEPTLGKKVRILKNIYK